MSEYFSADESNFYVIEMYMMCREMVACKIEQQYDRIFHMRARPYMAVYLIFIYR